MTKLKDILIGEGIANRILTDVDLNNLLDGTPAVRYGLVNKAMKKKELIKIRRGLYVLSNKYCLKKLSQLYIANKIVPHSYISLESALSYHGWIPERVTTIASVIAFGRTKQYATPFGEFAFYHLPINEYEFLMGVKRMEDIQDEPFFLASPLRALADLVQVKKIDWQGLSFLTDSLRIEPEQLMQINSDDFMDISNVYRSMRVLHFLNQLKKELKK